MSGNLNNVESESLVKIILLLLGASISAFLLTQLMDQITIILIHIISGRPEFYLYLHLFEWSYTDFPSALPDPIRWNLGSFINLGLSSILYLLLWGKRNHKLLPLIAWAPTAYTLQGYSVLASNVSWTSWSFIIELGFPANASMILGIVLFIIGFLLLLFIRPLIYDVTTIPIWKLLIINFTVIPFFQVISVLYSANFTLFGIIPILISGSLALATSILEKPLNPIIKRIASNQHNKIKWSSIGVNIILANIIIMIFILTPYEPLTEKALIADIIAFIIILIIFTIGLTFYLKWKGTSRSTKTLLETRETELKSKLDITPQKESVFQEAVKMEEKIQISEEVNKKEVITNEFLIEQQKILENKVTTKLSQDLKSEEDEIEEKIQEVTDLPSSMVKQEEQEEQELLDEEVVVIKDIESEKEEQTKTTIIEVIDGIKCEYCGFGNEKTATFCLQCGQAINKQI